MTHFGPVCSGGWKCLRAMLSNSINLNYYHSHWPEEVRFSCSSGPIESQLPFKFGQLILGLLWTATVVVLKEVNWVEIIARFNFICSGRRLWLAALDGEEELLWVLNPLCYSGIQFSLSFLPFEIHPQFISISRLFQPTLTPLLLERLMANGFWKNVEDVYQPENTRRRGRMQRRGDEMRLN